MPLDKEDYVEPNCPFCTEMWKKEKNAERVPVGRVFERLDNYFAVNDFESAERHLLYWAEEAEALGDLRGLFSITDEMMGLYRKVGRKEKAYAAVKKALELVKELGIEKNVAAATAYLNAATVYAGLDQIRLGKNAFSVGSADYVHAIMHFVFFKNHLCQVLSLVGSNRLLDATILKAVYSLVNALIRNCFQHIVFFVMLAVHI